MKKKLNRRSFLKAAGGTALSATALAWSPGVYAAEPSQSFRSAWQHEQDRVWPGAEYWSNPLQDWRIREGRLECFSAGGDRNVALLTREISNRSGDLLMSVRIAPLDAAARELGFVGFRLGTRGPVDDYRSAAIYGRGLNAGVDASGRLFIDSIDAAAPRVDLGSELDLRLEARPSARGYALVLRASAVAGGAAAEVRREVPATSLPGGIALVCSSGPVEDEASERGAEHDFNFYPPHQHKGGTMRFRFSDWQVGGSKIDEHDDRAWGPILFTMYTVSRGTLKLSAQFPPLGESAGEASLEIFDGQHWNDAGKAAIDRDAWNATFRVPAWDAARDHPFRVVYQSQSVAGEKSRFSSSGTIRRDPVDKSDVVVGLMTCMWDLGFPHTEFADHLAWHQPDLLLWTGDQIYEPVGGFGRIEGRDPALLEPSMLDFLRKWYLFGWSTRELMRNTPSVCMTDDHDMFHGNIWGCGGRPTNPALHGDKPQQDSGGYKMPARWVNMVQRAQTAHLPDPFDPTPVLQGISVYYTDLVWGGVSFAILEDRKWKSAPKEQLPGADIVNGFAQNPNWDPATQSNAKDAELMGERQLDFLEEWAADWSGGVWMKFGVSQTVFSCLHTEPRGVHTDDLDPHEKVPQPGTYIEGDVMIADHDSDAWPQHARDATLLKLRKAFAMHLCGDQHLASMTHQGVHEFRDAVWSICTPAISNLWPRRWFPPQPGENALPGTRNTGDYREAFGNRVTVLAVANPASYPGPGLDLLRDRATGYSIVTCNRASRRTTVTTWPRWVDPSRHGARPYAGWPVVVEQLDNGLHGAPWQLDPIDTQGHPDAVVQVRETGSGDLVYAVRMTGTTFTPLVREPGSYRVTAFDPDGDFYRVWENMEARRRRT